MFRPDYSYEHVSNVTEPGSFMDNIDKITVTAEKERHLAISRKCILLTDLYYTEIRDLIMHKASIGLREAFINFHRNDFIIDEVEELKPIELKTHWLLTLTSVSLFEDMIKHAETVNNLELTSPVFDLLSPRVSHLKGLTFCCMQNAKFTVKFSW